MSGDLREMDESRLRQALRLEAHELPPRLDPALIALAARSAPRGSSDVLPLAALAFAAGWVMSEVSGRALSAAGSLLGPEALALVIDALTAAAPILAPAVAFAASAGLGLAAAVTGLVVIAFQQQRRAQRA